MRVAALSLAGLRLDSLEHYREDLVNLLRKLRARLVVLPAHTSFFLGRSTGNLGREPDFKRAFTVFCDNPADWNSRYLELHASIAGKLGLYLVPGSTVEKTGAGCYHTAYCLDPGGEICAAQRQTHLSRAERELGLSRGVDLPLFQVDGMSAGLVVATDARHPEAGRILALQGADLLIHTGALPSDPANPARQLAEMWAQVQQNQCWAVEAQLHAEVCGRAFDGRSAVIGPCEVTGDFSGFLASEPAGGSAASAVLPETRRIELKKKYNLLKQLNPEAYAGGI